MNELGKERSNLFQLLKGAGVSFIHTSAECRCSRTKGCGDGICLRSELGNWWVEGFGVKINGSHCALGWV